MSPGRTRGVMRCFAAGRADDDVAAAVQAVAQAKRQCFLFGRGSRANDWNRRVALAELSGGAVITSLRERALFPTAHQLHAGPPIHGLTATATETLAAADVIVSFDWVDLNGLFQEMRAAASRSMRRWFTSRSMPPA